MTSGPARHDEMPGFAQIIRHGFPSDPRADAQVTSLDEASLLRNGIFGFDPVDERTRPFAMLRSQILRRLGRIDGHVLAVTSAQPGNGKSFVAANLAAAMSQIHPVWLVDLDLRRPSVADRFGLPPGPGVDDYLLGAEMISARDYRIGKTRMTVLPVRRPRQNSGEALASVHLAEVFAAVRKARDVPICIVDTPPVLQGDDMMIIAPHVDAVLLVVEEGRTRRRDLADAVRMLAPTPIIGSVLNKTIFPESSSYVDKKYAR